MDPPFYSAPASPAPTFPTGSFYSVRSNISISGRDQWNIITNNNVYSPTTSELLIYEARLPWSLTGIMKFRLRFIVGYLLLFQRRTTWQRSMHDLKIPGIGSWAASDF